jgi:two-component system, cell cycle response regulator
MAEEKTMDKENVRLLVADDEESIRGTLSALLGDEGYDVTAVPSAEEALERFGWDPFPLVITDIRMGGMSGIDLLKEVRTIRPETEVIIITSYASLETAVLALRSGAYDYLIKPFEELDLVVAAVARALEKSRLVREKMALIEALARKNDELQQVNRILAESVNRDGLTGLYNHRYLQEALNRELCLALRHDRASSLLFADVDNFKLYNDAHGHQAGDTVLKTIGDLLHKSIRGTDIVARYGGEEFVVLLPETGREQAGILAERIREAIAGHPFPQRQITISIGISTFPGDGKTPGELILAADRALYRAKVEGRNTVR